MFSAFKDAAYFSRVSGLCLKSFGVDIIRVSKAMNGELLTTTTRCRNEGLSLEEAATRCIAKSLRFIVGQVDIPDGNSPNHAQYARWATVVEGWLEQGLIDGDAYGEFGDTISYVLDAANRA